MFTISGSGRPKTAGPAHSISLVQNFIAEGAPERQTWLRVKLKDAASSSNRAELAELRALEAEGDPALFDAGLLQFAQRQKERGRAEVAAAVYAALSDFPNPSEYSAKARSQLQAMLGNGGFGIHAEELLHRFVDQSLEPSSFAGFLAGGLAFRLGRAWALGRLASTPGLGLAKNGTALRALAGLFGFGLEVPSFVLGTRAAAGVFGTKGAWNGRGLGIDLASAALMLGPMKLLAGGGAAVAARVWRPGSRAAASFVGASAFAGIFLGHRFEQIEGWKPSQGGAATLLDSLATLLQARVAGGIAERAGGLRWKLWERSLESRLSSVERGDFHGVGGAGLPAFASAAFASEAGGSLSMGDPFSENTAGKWRGVSLMATKGEGGPGRKLIGFDRGALAWGGDSALHWLLELRKNLEASGKSSEGLELWWIPETPVDTVLLNDFGIVYRRETLSFEEVNKVGQAPLRAFWPSLRNGEVFVHTADFSTDLGRILNKWSEREESGLQDLITTNWLELQFENLCRKKTGFVERIQENGKEFLLFEDGKRQLLPVSLDAYSDVNDPRSRRTKASVQFFQNQFWGRSPMDALAVFGAELHRQLPPATVISHFMDPRAMILPHWAGPRGMGVGTRFFLIQGAQAWMAGFDGAQFRDVTAMEPPGLVNFLRRILNQKIVSKKSDTPPSAAPEISAPVEDSTAGEPRATTRYPSEDYANSVFKAPTMRYPPAFPRESVVPESSLAPLMTTGPTEKITEGKPESPVPVAVSGKEHAVAMRAWTPSPPESGEGNPRAVVIPPMTPSARRQAALDPTLEIDAHQSEPMLEEKPLPFADTVIMDPVQMAEARRGKVEAAKWGPKKFFASAGRELLQAWRHRAWIWAEIRVALYRWVGKSPPQTLVARVTALRTAAKK